MATLGSSAPDAAPESSAQFALGPDPTYLDLLAGQVHAIEYAEPVLLAKEAPYPPEVVNTQFHAQSELGEYEYGYSNPTSTKYERKDALGNVEGTYSYVSPDGRIVTNNYVADPYGFRSSLAPANDEEWLPPGAPIPLPTGPGAVAAAPAIPVPAPAPAVVAEPALPVPNDPLIGVEIARAIDQVVEPGPLAPVAHSFPVHDAVPADIYGAEVAAAVAPAVAPALAPLPNPNLIHHAVEHHAAVAPPPPVVRKTVHVAREPVLAAEYHPAPAVVPPEPIVRHHAVEHRIVASEPVVAEVRREYHAAPAHEPVVVAHAPAPAPVVAEVRREYHAAPAHEPVVVAHAPAPAPPVVAEVRREYHAVPAPEPVVHHHVEHHEPVVRTVVHHRRVEPAPPPVVVERRLPPPPAPRPVIAKRFKSGRPAFVSKSATTIVKSLPSARRSYSSRGYSRSYRKPYSSSSGRSYGRSYGRSSYGGVSSRRSYSNRRFGSSYSKRW